MKNVCLIGAGNIGSRHLQGIKKVTTPLFIEVIDPSQDSLEVAKQRYNQINSSTNHKITFEQGLYNLSKKIDLAIIATSSNVRRKVIENLLNKSAVKYLILEKILFQKRKDYIDIEKLLKKKKIKTWVNFSMRTMPFYESLKGKLNGKIQMIVSGSQYGLITNVIHFIDYIAYLSKSYNFTVDTSGLDKKPVESKRKGFLELDGTLIVYFKNGSTGLYTCYPKGDSPFVIELLSENFRVISKESERKAFISSNTSTWKWSEIETAIPFQSDMTNILVEQILRTGKSNLTPYTQASILHLTLLENLLKFVNKKSGKKIDYYPFT